MTIFLCPICKAERTLIANTLGLNGRYPYQCPDCGAEIRWEQSVGSWVMAGTDDYPDPAKIDSTIPLRTDENLPGIEYGRFVFALRMIKLIADIAYPENEPA